MISLFKSKFLIALTSLWLVSCIGTDVVDDRLSAISLSAAGEETAISGSIARLVGESVTLEAWGMSDLGGSFQVVDVTWASSDEGVATIDEDGVVRALAGGTTFITATAQGVISDPVTISVAADLNTVALVQIVAANDATVINPGETLQLTGSTLNASGGAIDGGAITWSSSDEAVATVDASGLVSGVGDGRVRITGSAAGVTGFIDLFVGDATSLSRTGAFEGLNGYRASGDVTLMVNAEGNLTLVLADNFSAADGPGLYFYLSNQPSRVSGGIEIGAVRSVTGADEYAVPEGVGLGDFNHVVLYCKPFGVGFGTAQLDN